MESPIGFIPLQEAADIVGRKMGWHQLTDEEASWLLALMLIDCRLHPVAVLYGDSDINQVIRTVAEQCAAGAIAAVYPTRTGGVANLDKSVWLQRHWRNYFLTGEIDIDLPWVVNGREVTDGTTVRCTREIFVNKQDLDRFTKTLRSTPRKAALASKARISEIVDSYAASLNGANPSIPGLDRFAREAGLTGHREELRTMFAERFGRRRRGRPSNNLPR